MKPAEVLEKLKRAIAEERFDDASKIFFKEVPSSIHAIHCHKKG